MKTAIIVLVVLILILAFLLLRPRLSRADPATPPVPSNCDPNPIDSKIACATGKPGFPVVGDMINDGAQKYCCKSV